MNNIISIIGLGYVGLPLAIEFGKKFKTIGYDIDINRVNELKKSIDKTNEVEIEDFKKSKNLNFSNNISDLKKANIFIITVPTPIDDSKAPDLNPIKYATQAISKVISVGSIIIYESTVYPGCTENFCVPIIEKISNFKYNKDFFIGYSPERINPGDKRNKLTDIVKVTSGSTKKIAHIVDDLYKEIINAGTFKASSIKVAEASKAIENAQRDLNISFVNEIALIFDRLNINTKDVLDAAGSKWNFLNYEPGLVGGHCIGVDPYYLTHVALSNNYHPEVILSGRRVNENMGKFISNKILRMMIKNDIYINHSRILILGFSFKENCPDIRNTGVYKLYKSLRSFNIDVEVHDPITHSDEVKKFYNIEMLENIENQKFDVVIIAVSHAEFLKYDFKSLKRDKKSILFDIKSFIRKNNLDFKVDSEL